MRTRFRSPSRTELLSTDTFETVGGVESDSEEDTRRALPAGVVCGENVKICALPALSMMYSVAMYQAPVSALLGMLNLMENIVPPGSARPSNGIKAAPLGLRRLPVSDFAPDRSSLTWMMTVDA